MLGLCWKFDSEAVIPKLATTAIRRIHGVLNGISIDNTIRDYEIIGLKSWLSVYQHVSGYWPFCELWEIVTRILEDGKIDDNERLELIDYCDNFTETKIDDPLIHDEIYTREFMKTDAPDLLPFTALCDNKCQIQFKGRTFCFTGPARTGPRKELRKIVAAAGGKSSNKVVNHLDYLVISAQSSPCWAYSTYGRKIEKVINNRNKGDETTILHEDDFIEQAKIATIGIAF
jgi:NAD-dependent DNA ligase